jgi:hypothetical protein
MSIFILQKTAYQLSNRKQFHNLIFIKTIYRTLITTLFLFSFSKISLALEISMLAKLSLLGYEEYYKEKASFINVRNDGVFLFRIGNLGILVFPDGKYFFYKFFEKVSVSEKKESDQQYPWIIRNYRVTKYTYRGNKLSLKTASKKGFIVDEYDQIVTQELDFKGEPDWRVSPTTITQNNRLSKFDDKNNNIQSIDLTSTTQEMPEQMIAASFHLDSNSFPLNLGGGPIESMLYDDNPNQKYLYFARKSEDISIIFYRLTDSDLLSSPNRITLGASQNGSLTATVNNPEQALLNIQSSTNLIDWNTFKTIKNEPSLEIVVPANKQKEFIRATE